MTAMTTDKAKSELEKFVKLKTSQQPVFVDVILKALEDAEPVRHGRWLRTEAYPHRRYCSVCYATFIRNDEFLRLEDIPHDYCPNCGAKMNKRREDGTD